jgi:hypothetical protein
VHLASALGTVTLVVSSALAPTHVQPTSLPAGAQRALVRLHARGFASAALEATAAAAICRIGLGAPFAALAIESEAGSDRGSILCAVDAPRAAAGGTLPLRVAVAAPGSEGASAAEAASELLWSEPLELAVAAPILLLDIEPRVIAAGVAPAAPIRVRGQGFPPLDGAAPAAALCRWGGPDAPVSPGMRVAPDALLCPARALEPGEYSLSVALDGVNFEEGAGDAAGPGGLALRAVPQPSLLAVRPARVPLEGGAALTLFGAAFPRDVRPVHCVFGGIARAPAVVIDSRTVRCVAPSLAAAAGGAAASVASGGGALALALSFGRNDAFSAYPALTVE